MSGFGTYWAQSIARKTLTRLHEHVGTVGLLAAATTPGIAAIVDQHSAAIRDILTTGIQQPAATGGAIGAILLAGYAKGLIDQATQQGHQIAIPTDTKGWARADWLSIRLLAVCVLAKTADNPPRL